MAAVRGRRRTAKAAVQSRRRPTATGRRSRRRASPISRPAGRPVFVDFTAAWCVTCQVNKRLALNTDVVRDGVREAQRRARARRLDAPRSRDHAGADGAWPERCPGLRAAPAGQGAARAARGAAAADRARRAGDALSTVRGSICEVFMRIVALSLPFAAALLAPSVVRPIARRARAGVHAHRHRGQDGAARRLPRQVCRARVDESRMPVRAQALHQRQHAGPAEGMGRARRRLAVDQLDQRRQFRVQDAGADGAMDAGAGRLAQGRR